MKIRPVGVELFHADRRTMTMTMTKLIVAIRSFANVSKKEVKQVNILYYQ